MVVMPQLCDEKEYAPNDLKHLQEILLDILKDFIELCDKHDIEYFIDGGTTLGCVRHQGFIPWDDDIDIMLFRDQYNKFLKYRHELDDKYDILCSEDYEDYCRLLTRISLKNTKTGEIFDRNTNYTFGINIDVFAFDNIPNPGLKRKLFIFQFEIFRNILKIFEITRSDIYISRNKERIGHAISFILKILNINNKTVQKLGNKLIKKSQEIESDYVCNFSTPYSLSAFDKTIFESSIKAKFETIEVNLASGYDKYLRINYGDDYMELPPKDKRRNHKFNGFDFGEY